MEAECRSPGPGDGHNKGESVALRLAGREYPLTVLAVFPRIVFSGVYTSTGFQKFGLDNQAMQVTSFSRPAKAMGGLLRRTRPFTLQ